MAAKDSDETAAIYSPKRPRLDTETDLLQQRSCNKVVNSLEKKSEPLVETQVPPYFNNNRLNDVGGTTPHQQNVVDHHRLFYNNDDDGKKKKKEEREGEDEKNPRLLLNKINNNKDDPKMMDTKDDCFNEVGNHKNLFEVDDQQQRAEEEEGAAKNKEEEEVKTKIKNTTEQQKMSIFNSEEKEMSNMNLSCSHDPDDPDDDLDNVSEISDLAGLDEEAWRPVSGPLNWVQRQMSMGRDPRMLFKEIISPDTFIPPDLDEMTLWGLLANVITEPPKRKKLNHFNTIDDVVDLLRVSKKVMVLTGAGVSVSCGIPDFRSRDGIYARLAVDFPDLPDPQAMFDINYFRNDPRPFFKFAKEIYPGQFAPSKCHKFIKLIEDHGRLLHNYTQNIDTLEQGAGIKKVIQCHGSFATATCMKCSFKLNAEAIREDIFKQVIPKCPKCPPDCSTAIMKPDIVFFGENLPELFHYQMAEDKDQCDLLIVIGSSMKVRPVALIPNYIPAHVPQILINREPLAHMTFDVELLGDGDIIVNDLCKRLGDEWRDAFCASGPHAEQITKDQLEKSVPSSSSSPTSKGRSSDKSSSSQNSQSFGDALQNKGGSNDAANENGQMKSSSLCKKGAAASATTEKNGSCSEVKTPNDSESNNNCERGKVEENGENIDNLKSLWKKNRHRKQSLSRHLKDNQVLFIPPCQYAYPGAEIYSEDEDEEDELNDLFEESESHDSESSSSWESFSDEEEKKSSENGVISAPAMMYPNNLNEPGDMYPPHHAASGTTTTSGAGGFTSDNPAILSTDLKCSSITATSPIIMTKSPTEQLSSSDSLIQELGNNPAELQTSAMKNNSTTVSCSDTMTVSATASSHESQQHNGFVVKRTGGNKDSAVSEAVPASSEAEGRSVETNKNQHIRTENLVSTCPLPTQQDTSKTYTETDTISSSSTLTLMDGKH